eukprot:Hpha_TRINITY_DN6481_c0_g1::TRINITY_DN6481_c0_g1_i2::g.70::m.70
MKAELLRRREVCRKPPAPEATPSPQVEAGCTRSYARVRSISRERETDIISPQVEPSPGRRPSPRQPRRSPKPMDPSPRQAPPREATPSPKMEPSPRVDPPKAPIWRGGGVVRQPLPRTQPPTSARRRFESRDASPEETESVPAELLGEGGLEARFGETDREFLPDPLELPDNGSVDNSPRRGLHPTEDTVMFFGAFAADHGRETPDPDYAR